MAVRFRFLQPRCGSSSLDRVGRVRARPGGRHRKRPVVGLGRGHRARVRHGRRRRRSRASGPAGRAARRTRDRAVDHDDGHQVGRRFGSGTRSPPRCGPRSSDRGSFRLAKVRVRVENHSVWMGRRRSATRSCARPSWPCTSGLRRRRRLHLAARPARVRQARGPVVPAPRAVAGAGRARRHRQLLLGSPIILYDHPEIAPESSVAMFDSTEIDEILALRVMTSPTRRSARPAAPTHGRPRSSTGSTTLPPEIFERLHGAIRSLRPHRPDPLDGPSESSSTTSRPSAEPPRRRGGPGVDGAVDPWSDTTFIDGSWSSGGPGCSCAPAPGPTPTICSSPVVPPSCKACSSTSTATPTSP